MKLSGTGLLLIFVSLGMLSCFDPPEYPIQPEIEFRDVVFKQYPDNEDSLIVELFFRDGDGDLGLQPSETGCYGSEENPICYNEKFNFTVTEGPNAGKRLNYAIKRTDPLFASLPDYVKPFDCINWELERNSANQVIDTVYIELNPNHYNIFVDYLVKQPDGSFKEFDFREEFCSTYDGRFPVLAKNLNQPGPLEGVLRYGMRGTGFLFVFSIKTLKLRIQIQDRALNKSNTIESPEFTLQSIRG
ncbi:MAG: hypothetical protein ACOYXA_03490 [Bacteroidota bacterium]